MASEKQSPKVSRRNAILGALILAFTSAEIVRELRNSLYSASAEVQPITPTPGSQPSTVYIPGSNLDDIVQTSSVQPTAPTPTPKQARRKEPNHWGAPWQQVVPGVYYMHETIPGPVNVHNVMVDLLSSEVSLHNIYAQSPNQNYIRESLASIAARIPWAITAVNCDYPNSITPEGTNIENGSRINFNPWRASLHRGKRGNYNINILREDSLDNIVFAIGGGPIIMWNNEYNFNPLNEGFEPDILRKYECDRDAHTLLFLSEYKRWLLIMVYDGRSAQSIGMTPREAVGYVNTLSHIWHTGMMGDGGQSSHLLINGETVNNPIDGGRPLSNALVVVEEPRYQKIF